MIPQRIRKHIPSFLFAVSLIIILYLLSSFIPESTLKEFIRDAGMFAPLAYFLLTLFSFVFAPLSSSPLIFAGFYLLGQQIIFLNILATIIASIINFWIARTWGRNLVAKLVGKSSIEEIDKFSGKYGLQALFVLRVFQGGIHDFISYAAGLTSIKFLPYFIISIIGMVPGYLIWYALSTKVQNPLIFTLLTLFLTITFSALYIFALYLQRKFR